LAEAYSPVSKQFTLAQPVEAEGIGLHTGTECSVRLSPAPEGGGLVFLCGDDLAPVPALAENVIPARRRTVLACEGHRIETVEHILAALVGTGVFHARIQVKGPEVPALDGSALPFVELIEQAGTAPVRNLSPVIVLTSPVRVSDNGAEAWVEALPGDEYRVSVSVWYAETGEQKVGFEITPEVFKKEIAPARTFGFEDEAELVLRNGFAAGAGPDNVVLISRGGKMSSPARLENEVARHKVLDLVGDLALSGGVVKAHIIAARPGHRLNTRLAALLSVLRQEKK
jgi:UDP-3-O-[3-hydroxymyristoyl] N-acetylglucosamine deacetylase